MERLVGLRPEEASVNTDLSWFDGSGGRPKDVKKAEPELQLDWFCGRVSGRMEGFPARLWSAMLMSLKQTGEYVKAIFRSSPWTFLVWRKRRYDLIKGRIVAITEREQPLLLRVLHPTTIELFSYQRERVRPWESMTHCPQRARELDFPRSTLEGRIRQMNS